ncbi:alpha/beta-hydrolase [Auricularia subglabra TFB-10046 SS5]|nr:alpha/beta-hydrolase [Auricularia subglabra TFB-10046 SS5]
MKVLQTTEAPQVCLTHIGLMINMLILFVALMKRSLEIEKPFIFVATNYRLGPYGFLASATMSPQDMNAGLSDQQEAFRFIKANARAIGADPDRITIWGQSAGASSVGYHWLFSSPLERLFSAAIMDSGGPTQYPQAHPASFDLSTGAFSQLGSLAGCSGGNSIGCLRAMPFAQLFNATNALLQRAIADPTYTAFPPALDGIFIREHSSRFMRQRRMLPVPIIMGGPTDDGTLFTLNSTDSTADIRSMITSVLNPPSFLITSVFERILQLYPDDPSLGAPFGTGNNTFGLSSQWKRAAAIFGDQKYNSAKRFNLRSAIRGFGFTWDIAANGTLPFRGVPHGAELAVALFGPGSGPFGPTVGNEDASQALLDGYLHFVSDRVPRMADGATWSEYSKRNEIMMFQTGNVTAVNDSVRHEPMEFFITHFDAFLK